MLCYNQEHCFYCRIGPRSPLKLLKRCWAGFKNIQGRRPPMSHPSDRQVVHISYCPGRTLLLLLCCMVLGHQILFWTAPCASLKGVTPFASVCGGDSGSGGDDVVIDGELMVLNKTRSVLLILFEVAKLFAPV